MRLQVHLQREIARLHHYDTRLSNAKIAQAVGVSPTTVSVMRSKVKSCREPWETLSCLEDADFRRLLGTDDQTITQSKPHPDWSWVHEQMQLPDNTLSEIWADWRESEPNGIGQSRFCELYAEWVGSLRITMRMPHLPGQKLFVDFAGRTVEIRDREGGPPQFAKLFVGVLGYSNWTYIRAVASETVPDWIDCHVRCFEAMGGVPEYVVPDNLKSAVLGRDADGNVRLNRSYKDALEHYGTAALPASPRKPKGKSKAEVGVQIVQRLLYRLRHHVFFSLADLNQALQGLADWLNKRSFKTMDGSRTQRFTDVEAAALKALPETPYTFRAWQYGALVKNDHHVQFERNDYSVPHTKVGHRVDVRASTQTVEIFSDNVRIATHPRLSGRGKASTLIEHRPLRHIAVLEGEPEMLLRWAHSVGPMTEQMIRYHLQERGDVTNGTRAANAIRNLARDHGDIRIEEVCTYANRLNLTALTQIKNILKKDRDRSNRGEGTRPVIHHENIRGGAYYDGAAQ